MQISATATRIGIAAIFLAQVAVMAAIAYGAGDLAMESVFVGDDEVVVEAVDQRAYGAVSIARVVTPVDGWVLVRADWGDGVPAELIGAAAVRAGETLNVPVVMDASRELPPAAFVSVAADRGAIDEFEYITGDPDDTFSLESGGGGMMGGGEDDAPPMTESMDWPLVRSDGETISDSFAITPFNIVYRIPQANIGEARRDIAGTSAVVERVDAPEQSWVVIIQVGTDAEEPNQVLGYAPVPAGHTESVTVDISQIPDAADVSALLVADLGAPGVLEVDPVDPPRSVDAPYLVRSWFVWKTVTSAR